MNEDELSIEDLAAAVGMTRRGVRFYVQAKLLPPPLSRGRGAHYGKDHLKQLQRIIDLQATGHSLDEIRRIFAGTQVPTPDRPMRSLSQVNLFKRLTLCEGVELSFDTAHHQPALEDLQQLKELVNRIFSNNNNLTNGDPHARD